MNRSRFASLPLVVALLALASFSGCNRTENATPATPTPSPAPAQGAASGSVPPHQAGQGAGQETGTAKFPREGGTPAPANGQQTTPAPGAAR